MSLSRRTALLGMAGAASLPLLPVSLAQGLEGRKFIFIILRGAMDGLATLVPDDGEMRNLRRQIQPPQSDLIDLNNGFRLHPSLSGVGDLYRSGDVAFVHAASTSFRARSHFDAQDFLETLAGGTYTQGGWLNRAVGAVNGQGLGVGYTLPLALTGPAQATNWAPSAFRPASHDLLDRLAMMYEAEPGLFDALETGREMAVGSDMSMSRGRGRNRQFSATLKALGELMAQDGGANIGMASLDGWDTHANQVGRLTTLLNGMDDGLVALKSALGPVWQQTAIVMCSEFGRTAAENGSRGTDHGTGGLVILAGGAISGGKIHGDWPGLQSSALYEGRDLAPANDISAIMKGVLRDHLGIDRASLDNTLFPSSAPTFEGLISA